MSLALSIFLFVFSIPIYFCIKFLINLFWYLLLGGDNPFDKDFFGNPK